MGKVKVTLINAYSDMTATYCNTLHETHSHTQEHINHSILYNVCRYLNKQQHPTTQNAFSLIVYFEQCVALCCAVFQSFIQ